MYLQNLAPQLERKSDVLGSKPDAKENPQITQITQIKGQAHKEVGIGMLACFLLPIRPGYPPSGLSV